MGWGWGWGVGVGVGVGGTDTLREFYRRVVTTVRCQQIDSMHYRLMSWCCETVKASSGLVGFL